MTPKQKAELAQSKRRERLGALINIEERSDAEMAELVRITDIDMPAGEVELRAAISLETTTGVKPATATGDQPAEDQALIELRSACTVQGYLSSAASGRSLSGSERELNHELGMADNAIPISLWGSVETRAADAVAAPPTDAGVNLDLLRPMIFAPSVAGFLAVDMPQVESGGYASATISTAATAEAAAKGGAVPQTASAFTSQSTKAHRIGGSIAVSVEDVVNVGQANYEALLREHISLVVSNALDSLLINGDVTSGAAQIEGFLKRLADPTATNPASGAPVFDDYITAFADGIEGTWATMLDHVAILAGVATYKLTAKTFRDGSGINATVGAVAAASYLQDLTGGWRTSSRMPVPASDVQSAILVRKGASTMPMPMRTAVCPYWSHLEVDDIYSGARKGERYFTVSALVGDVIIVQPSAYSQVNFRTAA